MTPDELAEALRRELEAEDEDRAERVEAFRRELEARSDIPESPERPRVEWSQVGPTWRSFEEIKARWEADDQGEREEDP